MNADMIQILKTIGINIPNDMQYMGNGLFKADGKVGVVYMDGMPKQGKPSFTFEEYRATKRGVHYELHQSWDWPHDSHVRFPEYESQINAALCLAKIQLLDVEKIKQEFKPSTGWSKRSSVENYCRSLL
jgi:hypothetical protein